MTEKPHKPLTRQNPGLPKDHPQEERWTDQDELVRDRFIKETSGDRGRSLESEDKE